MEGGTVARLEKVANVLSRWLNWIGAGALIAVMLLVCANIIGRAVPFLGPVKGTYDLVGLFGGIMLGFALGYTQLQKRNISVEILVSRLRPRTRAIIDSITFLMSLALFVLIAWHHSVYATSIWKVGELSETLRIPFFPLIYAVAFGCIALCLVLLVDFLKALAEVRKK